jgi:uridine phosphorylase
MINLIPETELVLNPDGSVYHLNLLPEDIGQTIFLVGDQERVPEVSKHFDRIEVKKNKREFFTHTGYIGQNKVSVISTGIGTDNIDIVLNELDALLNINLKTREVNPQPTSINLIRIGTSGALQENIPVDSILVSAQGLGLDGLLWYYDMQPDENIDFEFGNNLPKPYLVNASFVLLNKFNQDSIKGITATCSGFYGPQGRTLRAKNNTLNLINKLKALNINGKKVTNFEMETSAILALSKLFGFNAIAINAIIANRITHQFSKNLKNTIEKTITYTLNSVF